MQIDGPKKGFATNFLSTLQKVDPLTKFVALSDQDDVWHLKKLERAAVMLENYCDTPAMYGATSWVCDQFLVRNGLTRVTTVPLGFCHAIGQNFAGGNTMVFNNAALRLIQAAGKRAYYVPVHDWWLYQLISGSGGTVIFDPRPCLEYRQHSDNQIGSANGFFPLVKRLRRMVCDDYWHWNTANLASLQSCSELLDKN